MLNFNLWFDLYHILNSFAKPVVKESWKINSRFWKISVEVHSMNLRSRNAYRGKVPIQNITCYLTPTNKSLSRLTCSEEFRPQVALLNPRFHLKALDRINSFDLHRFLDGHCYLLHVKKSSTFKIIDEVRN